MRETYWSIYSYQKIRKVESSRRLLKKKLQDKGRFSPIKCLQRNFFWSNCRFLFKLRYKSTQNSFLLCFVSNIRFLHFTERDKMHLYPPTMLKFCFDAILPWYRLAESQRPFWLQYWQSRFFYRNITDFLCCLRHLQASFTDRQIIMGKL